VKAAAFRSNKSENFSAVKYGREYHHSA